MLSLAIRVGRPYSAEHSAEKEFSQELRSRGWLGVLKLLALPDRLQVLIR
jgi:hypothetical protein